MSTSRQNKEIAKTKDYYEKYAEQWVKTHSDPFHDVKEFRIFKRYFAGHASILDIGCAGGVLVPLFLGIGRGLTYEGVDITSKFISIARQRYPQLTFTQGDITKIKTLPRKKFDGFIARAVLMHLPFELWNIAFENIEKITKRGAHGYIVLPSRRPPSMSLIEDPRHFTLLPEKEQIAFMKKRDWKIVKKFTHAIGRDKAQWTGYIVKLP